MKKIIIFLLFVNLLTCKAYTIENLKIYEDTISELPVTITKPKKINANLIGIIGGKGIQNKSGASNNYLYRYKDSFVENGIAFYLFPNANSKIKASYKVRASKERINSIKKLVDYISNINDKPIYIIGFSRGSVDAGIYGKKNPKSISGIILASAIYKNNSNKAKNYSMDKIIGNKINVDILVVHHEKDLCPVTQFKFAKKFYDKLNTKNKKLLKFTDGTGTGRECGPYHHHGYEGIEEKVANEIAKWINEK